MSKSDEGRSPQRWHDFLQSTAISYVAPSSASTSTSVSTTQCPLDYYWHQDLLAKWNDIIKYATVSKNKRGVTSISYGAYMLMATFLAEKLRCRLSLIVQQANGVGCDINEKISSDQTLRIGVAIPEGPFLPLYTLAIHSLNVSVGEGWLVQCKQHGNEMIQKPCRGVVLIPMETDEAPDRLRHMLIDSSPNLILVALGKDMENMQNALEERCSSDGTSSPLIELVDYTQLMEEALSSLLDSMQVNDGVSLLEQLYPPEVRNDVTDIQRYLRAIPDCYDVARLVAMGIIRLACSFSIDAPPRISFQTSKRDIMSHIVFTSGTTGKPKGCVSSLASLQHYIRAKNAAHEITNQSKVLLASAITFDPCFSDVLATCVANATLCIAPRDRLYSRSDEGGDEYDENERYQGLTKLLRQLVVTHVLCTPTLWATVEGSPPENVPSLEVIALGGEPIPKAMVGKWARTCATSQEAQEGEFNREYPRLCSTYGVTEACVYQTCGEIYNTAKSEDSVENGQTRRRPGQCVGLPLLGTSVHICQPHPDDGDMDQVKFPELKLVKQNVNSQEPVIGEVVLSGAQLDQMSSYLNMPELTARVFIKQHANLPDLGGHSCFYRSGDLGFVEPKSGKLHILGRIKGDGMVKINGIRLELAEIESAAIDDNLSTGEEGKLVTDCMAAITCTSSTDSDDDQHKQLIAYCLLSDASITQFGIPLEQLRSGAIIPQGPLLSLLRARCDRRLRKGCTPSFFVLIDRLPLSPTGKRNRSALPPLDKCDIIGGSGNSSDSLWEYGEIGPIVANKICECLNLQPCQRNLLTYDATISLLGGDSLSVTRIVRGLYAQHHGILDSRNLGGKAGSLDGCFAAKHLIQAKSLGDYVKHLEAHGAFQNNGSGTKVEKNTVHEHNNINDSNDNEEGNVADSLYESLIESTTLRYTALALALLDLGVDPSSQTSRGRLGKVRDRRKQRALFKSNPLHLACLHGDSYLVEKLLSKGCKACIPDASGFFPVHLACSRSEENNDDGDEKERKRITCVKLLLDSGKTPISIKDGNKSTILHSAARAGHCKLLTFIMKRWKIACETTGMKFSSLEAPGRIYDWRDRWSRTPVHWAILNQRLEALRILLDEGCSAFPPKPKSGLRNTSVIIESPLEMCQRLYGDTEGIGKEISSLLRNAEY